MRALLLLLALAQAPTSTSAEAPCAAGTWPGCYRWAFDRSLDYEHRWEVCAIDLEASSGKLEARTATTAWTPPDLDEDVGSSLEVWLLFATTTLVVGFLAGVLSHVGD